MAPLNLPPEEKGSASARKESSAAASTSAGKADTSCTRNDNHRNDENPKVINPQNERSPSCEIKNGLKDAVLRRRASLSADEKAFLHALLVDPVGPADDKATPTDADESTALLHKAVLDDDVLFSLPFGGRGDDIGGARGDSGIEAKGQYEPMQPGDVECTYADVTELDRAIGFKPNTSIEDGLRKFVDWYRGEWVR